MGVIAFVPEIKRLENFPDLTKLVYVNSAWSTEFIVKNIEKKSKEANDLSHSFVKVRMLGK